MEKAIVLLSGGQDSTTALAWAVNRFYGNVRAIGFNYGQKHAKELEFAQMNADYYNIPFDVINMMGMFGSSSLTDHNKDHNETVNGLPASFTAGRNMLFLTIAAIQGYNQESFDIVTGVCQTDFSGYPDCRRVFIDSLVTTLTLATGKDFRIHTPLMYLDKAETWGMANNFGILHRIINFTMTDYNGDMTRNEWGYGKLDNAASILREAGFKKAKEHGWI